jgi:hypothetical protein
MIATSLPPHITPTLPPTTTTPGGLHVPTGATPATPATRTETTPSGLIVVRHQLTSVAKGAQLIVATKPLGGNAALDAAKSAHAQLAASQGTAVADIVHGGELQLAQGIRNDELRREAVEAIIAGDLARAAELLAQRG